MKKTLTPDQLAKRDERRSKFRLLVKQVAEMSAVQKAEMARRYGARKLDGSEFSLCNQMLLALQLPEATLVAGFRQWLKAGRCVCKGQHGAMIWVPIGGSKKVDDVTGANTTESDGEKCGFIPGSVFDIGQTQPWTACNSEGPSERINVTGEISAIQ